MNSIDSSNIKKPTWRNRLFSLITGCLTHPWLGLFLAVLAILLCLPSLWSGFQLDDYLHRMYMLDLSPFPRHSLKIFSAYDFVGVNPEKIRAGIEAGIFPWWTAPDFRVSFLRPLSSMFIWLDYQLWPNLPIMMHLHSIAWYAAIVAIVTFFYRRIMGATWIAGLAALLFAIDSRHGIPVAWIANRYALISFFFGVLCLIAYDGWRRSGKKWLALASPVLLAVALLSGEMVLAVPAYLFAYAVALDRGRLPQRLLALLPNAGIVLAWLAAYHIFRYGPHGSSMYLNPFEEPIAFISAFISSTPRLLLAQWAPIPAQIDKMIPFNAVIAIISVFIITLIFLMYRLVRHDRVARFWTIGMLLSLVPIAGVDPSERLLIFVGLGAMGLMAQLLGGLVEKSASLPASRAWRRTAIPLGIVFALAHIVISPLAFPSNPKYLKLMGDFYADPIRSFPNDRQLRKQCLILVNPPDYHCSVGQAPFFRIVEGKAYPRLIRSLSGGPGPAKIIRVDKRTLRVKTPRGLFNYALGNLYVAKDKPLLAGQEFNLSDMSVHIHGMDVKQGPTDVTYRFTVPLEDASLRWLRLENGKYVPFDPPAIGKSVVIHGVDLMDIFFDTKG